MRLDLAAFRFLAKRSFWIDWWRKINSDDCWGRAAQSSYYFLLAFFPFLIFVSALVGFIPYTPDLVSRILAVLDRFLPENTYQLVRAIVLESVRPQNTGVISAGVVLALWSASLGFSGMVGVLNRAYVTTEKRSYLHVVGLSILVTIVVSIFVIVAHILIFFGGYFIEGLLTRFYLSSFYPVLWQVLRWMLIFLFLNLGIQIIYHTLPARRLPWKLISPGAIFTALGWIFGSMGFTFYVNKVANYERLYGGLGTFIVLMIWFYLSSLFLLLGGEIDSAIYRLRRERERVKF